MAKNYVNNAQFLELLVERKAIVKQCKELGFPVPPVSAEIGEVLLRIGKRLSSKGNFFAYSWREDMVMDGIENSLRYIDNFDETKTQNPFAYFTQVMWCAFVRHIETEDKNLYIKYKSLTNFTNMTEYATSATDDGVYSNTFVEHLRENATNIIQDYEEKQERKRLKKESKQQVKKKGLNKLLVDGEEIV